MAISWNTSLETGIRQVDLQHQELIEMINELEVAHQSGQDDVALKEVLPKLTTYVLFHFNDEEAITTRVATGTAHAQRHIAEHREFTTMVDGLNLEKSKDIHQAVADLISYLQQWLVNHIMVTDKEMANIFLRSKKG